MFCPSCGSQIPDESQLCPSCGADVSGASALVAQINELPTDTDTAAAEVPASEPAAAPVEPVAVPVEPVAAPVELVAEPVEAPVSETPAAVPAEPTVMPEAVPTEVPSQKIPAGTLIRASENIFAKAGATPQPAAPEPAEVSATEVPVAEELAAETRVAAPAVSQPTAPDPITENSVAATPAAEATVVVPMAGQDAPTTVIPDAAPTTVLPENATSEQALPSVEPTVQMPTPVPAPSANPIPSAIPTQVPAEQIPQASPIPQASADSAAVVDASAPAEPTVQMPTPQPSPQAIPGDTQGSQQAYTAPAYQSVTETSTPAAPQKKRSIGKLILGALAALVAFGIATGNARCHMSFNNEPVVSVGGSGEKREGFPARATDSKGNITVYSFLELDGRDLSTLLKQQDYTWYNTEDCWLRDDDAAAFAATDSIRTEDMLSRNQIKRLHAGGEGKSICFINSVAGYSSVSEAFEGAVNVGVVGSLDLEDRLFAELEDSAGNRYILFGMPHENAASEPDGTMDFHVLNEGAIADGMIEDMFGFDLGSSADEVWETISGNLEDSDISIQADI